MTPIRIDYALEPDLDAQAFIAVLKGSGLEPGSDAQIG